MTQSAPAKSSLAAVLSAAVRWWVRSQLDAADTLHVEFVGRNRDLLRGYVPQIDVRAERAVYQGLHLRGAIARAENLRLNLSQVLRGQPLRLLEPLPVSLDVQLHEDDLTASLASPLLQSAVCDLFRHILPPDTDLATASIRLSQNALQLTATHPQPLTLTTTLQLSRENHLQFRSPTLETSDRTQEFPTLDVPLDAEVQIQQLVCDGGRLQLSGRLLVRSDDPQTQPQNPPSNANAA